LKTDVINGAILATDHGRWFSPEEGAKRLAAMACVDSDGGPIINPTKLRTTVLNVLGIQIA
jgi:hypothetical protein